MSLRLRRQSDGSLMLEPIGTVDLSDGHDLVSFALTTLAPKPPSQLRIYPPFSTQSHRFTPTEFLAAGSGRNVPRLGTGFRTPRTGSCAVPEAGKVGPRPLRSGMWLVAGMLRNGEFGVCTLCTLRASDRVVLVPDRAGFRMFPWESSVCGGGNAVRVPPRAQCFLRSEAF
jgi:hypothetical protein